MRSQLFLEDFIMPLPGKRWRLVTISTHCAWLPGDERGFRSRDHKIHSSGDYRHRPPIEEHAGLRRYAKRISGEPVILPREVRRTIGLAILEKLKKLGHHVLAISVSGMHVHCVIELPDDERQIRAIIGQCKSKASHAIRDVLPGRVWARDGDFEPLDDTVHHLNAYGYVLDQDNAWVWSYRGWERVNRRKEKPRDSKTRPRGL